MCRRFVRYRTICILHVLLGENMKQKKMDLRVVKTLHNIQTSFLILLETKQQSDITVKEICDLAQCSRNTFYMHYQYKEDLYEQLAEEHIAKIIAGFRLLPRLPMESEEQLITRYIHNIVTSMYESKDTIRKLVRTDDGNIFKERLFSAIYEHMLAGNDESLENALNSAEYALMCGYCASSLVGFLLEWIHRDAISAQEAEKILVSLHAAPFVVTRRFVRGSELTAAKV